MNFDTSIDFKQDGGSVCIHAPMRNIGMTSVCHVHVCRYVYRPAKFRSDLYIHLYSPSNGSLKEKHTYVQK